MRSVITAMPVMDPKDWLRKPALAPLLSAEDRVSFWYGARTAIWQGLHWLGLHEGHRILAPAYACGSEVDTLVKARLVVDYYRILPDLSPDLDHLADLCATPARAVFVTHYFGFAQPMERISAFARERGLWVVEDNAHGLYSTNEQGQPLGTLGDIGVLSFTKALAMPDGGALIVKDGAPHERAAPPRGVAPAPLRVAGRMKSLLEGALVRRYPTATRAIKKRAADPLIAWIKTLESGNPSGPDTTEVRERRLFEFDPERARWRMSGLARRLLLRSMPPDGVISARRQNFMTLLRNFKGGDRVVPLLDALPRGCCPLFFPVLMKTGNDLRAFLTAHGVESHRFGFVHEAIPGEQFPFEDTLKRDVLGLPVHQGLGETDMLYVAHLLEKWESGRIERKVSR